MAGGPTLKEVNIITERGVNALKELSQTLNIKQKEQLTDIVRCLLMDHPIPDVFSRRMEKILRH